MNPKTKLRIKLSLIWAVAIGAVIAANLYLTSRQQAATEFEASNGVRLRLD